MSYATNVKNFRVTSFNFQIISVSILHTITKSQPIFHVYIIQ